MAEPGSFFRVAPGGALRGRLRVPGDKSISHRALLLGAIAEGETDVEGFLEAEDTLATLAALRQMGVDIRGPEAGRLSIRGAGLHGLRAPAEPLYLGNSGTSMRLLAGLLAGQPFSSVLTGDASLSRRPMARVTAPLAEMGADVSSAQGGTPPLTIHGRGALQGIDYAMPVASAQVKSCLLLAGLYAQGRTCVREPAPTRDHTERMLVGFGCDVVHDGEKTCVSSGARLRGGRVAVPGDLSSAAFFLVGAAIAPGSDITIERVGVNPTRSGVIDILRRMGASIEVLGAHEVSGEPVADLRVRHSRLRGVSITPEEVSLAIDEFPALFVAAACAEGETILTGAEELRVKESDRISSMAEGLQRLGAAARPTADGIVIRGGAFRGAEVMSHGDHRVAMALAMAALRSEGEVTIRDCDNVETSFPGFAGCARAAGLAIEATTG